MFFFPDLFAPKDNGDFWGDYKLKHPAESSAIEKIAGENFSVLSNKDAREKFASLERLAENNECSIVRVKDVFLRSFITEFGNSEDVLREAIQMMAHKMLEEALRFNIAKSNTASYYIRKWLLELYANNF